jgi:hypothetical protein
MPSSREHVEHVVGSHEHSDEDGSWSHVHIYPKDVEHKHVSRLTSVIFEPLRDVGATTGFTIDAGISVGGVGLKSCPKCGCAVVDEKVHLEWHGHLMAIFESQLKVVETKLNLR